MHLSLLVTLALCGLTTARPPAGFNRPSKGDGMIGESSPQKQTSRDEILLRERRKAARQQVDQAHKRWLGPGMRSGGTRVRRATPPAAVSAVLKRGAREDCPVEGVESGWARFKGWELEWNDLPGQAFETSSEGACIGLCTAFGSGCAGAQYLPEYVGANCYLKAPTINNGHFTSQTEEAKSVDAVLLLVGGCGVWTPMIAPQMDQACCNT